MRVRRESDPPDTRGFPGTVVGMGTTVTGMFALGCHSRSSAGALSRFRFHTIDCSREHPGWFSGSMVFGGRFRVLPGS